MNQKDWETEGCWRESRLFSERTTVTYESVSEELLNVVRANIAIGKHLVVLMKGETWKSKQILLSLLNSRDDIHGFTILDHSYRYVFKTGSDVVVASDKEQKARLSGSDNSLQITIG